MSELVIDGDVLLYRFAFSNQFKVRWDENTTSEVMYPFEKARDDLDRFIERLRKATKCADFLVALSHPLDFRFKVDPSYQAGRKDLSPPVYKSRLLEYVQEEYPCIMLNWLEADDVLGLKATEDPDVLIATIDKDLCQIPGRLYNWNYERFITISIDDANHFFFRQLLMGDSTDGIKGIPKVGPKKADAFLDGWHGRSPEDTWRYVLKVYEDHGLTKEYAMRQARLVRILRSGEYDYAKKQPILWKGF